MCKTFSRYRMMIAAAMMSMMLSPALGQNNIPREEDYGHDHDCESLTSIVEKTFDLPAGILTSISRVEAGRIGDNGEHRAWPWTINHAGKGVFFDSKDEMLDYIRTHLDDSDQNIDIGCMQINYFWHSDQFMDLDEMADPFTNIVYSAIFLTDLKAAHDSWDQAIRHYHNANPDQNTPYVEKVYAVWDMLNDATGTPILTDQAPLSDHTQPINLISAIPPDLPPVKEDASTDKDNSPQTELAPDTETTIVQVATAPEKPDTPIVVDPLAKLKARQPHLKGKWEKVIQFRHLLTP